MDLPESLKKHILILLEESGKPLSIQEIAHLLKTKLSITKSKQQIRNALYNYNCKKIIRTGRETYDLLPRIANGSYFRYTLSDTEISQGFLSCDYELQFIFDPYWQENKRLLKFFYKNAPLTESWVEFQGTKAVPLRKANGFENFFRENNLASDDDLIIKIVDIDNGSYELFPVKKSLRNEKLIQQKNRVLADLMEKTLNRIDIKGVWVSELVRRVMALYSYKDKCPPDSLSRIAKSDRRFLLYEADTMIFLADKIIIGADGVPMPKNKIKKYAEYFADKIDAIDKSCMGKA
jgi:hypothetical protein